MSEIKFKPYNNEADVFMVDEITFENRVDSISLFGDTEITKDREGLKKAKLLQEMLIKIINELEEFKDLPEFIEKKESNKMISNPFGKN